MAEPAGTTAPVARSPIRQAEPVAIHAGWEVSRAVTDAPLRLVDLTPLTKVLVRSRPGSEAAALLACSFGASRRDDGGELVIGSGPDEWLLLAPAGTAPALLGRLPASDAEPCTVIDATHGRVVLRLTGEQAADLLSRVCAVDLGEATTPNGAAFRSSVARLACLVVRDDLGEVRSYLVCSDRSSGQYLFDALAESGAEFSLATEGYPDKEI